MISAGELVEPGLYATLSSTDRPSLVALAARLGATLPEGSSAPGEHLELLLDAADPDGAGALYRFGEVFLLVVALNGEGAADAAWAELRARVAAACGPGVATACFATSDGPPGAGFVPVEWGWVKGGLSDLIALGNGAKETEAHRFLSAEWPVAVEFARQAAAAVSEGEEVSARLRRAKEDQRALAAANEALGVLGANLGRLGSVSARSIHRALYAAPLGAWAAARKRWAAEEHDPVAPRVEGLPYPVAGALRGLGRLWSPYDRFVKAVNTTEAILSLGAALLAARAWSEDVRVPGAGWESPALGTWPTLASAILAAARWPAASPLVDPRAWQRARAITERVAHIRNLEQGHGALRLDHAIYTDLSAQVEGTHAELLATLGGFAGVRLAWIRSLARPRGAAPTARVAWLVGSNPYFDEEEVPLPASITHDREVVCEWDGRVLPMHPFVHGVEVGGLLFVGVLAGIPGREGRYLCRVTGEQRTAALLEDERAALG